VDSESCLVKIALELKAGSLNELLIFRVVGNVRHLTGDVGAANPLQVGVKIAVGAGQQAGRLGRGMLAQDNRQGDGSRKQQKTEQNGEEFTSSYSHEK
jgi:hypothetical protein